MPHPDFPLINRLIEEAGAQWTAAETSVSSHYGAHTSPGLFGLSFDPKKAKEDNLATRSGESNLLKVVAPPPSRLDWRANGGNFVTPVRDQGTCGSCVAFATCGSIEARINIALAQPGGSIDLSEAHLFYCGVANACEHGWFYDHALDFAKKTGVGLEKDFPYTPGNQACRKTAAYVKVKSWTKAASSIARKQALMKGPVIGGLQIFEDFYAYAKGIYQHVAGNFLGWHAVTIVGYDDKDACWIAKNSWGAGWGERGFFRIAYGQCAMDSQVLFYDPDITIVSPDEVAAAEGDGAPGRKHAKGRGSPRSRLRG